jgi:two-component system response regulator AtoC
MVAPETVVVADDDDVVLHWVGDLFQELGYRVQQARTGEEALQRVQADRPTALLLDMVLPGIHGLEVLRRLRANGDELPVIIMSAFDQPKLVVEAMRLGALDYLTKPIGRAEVQEAVTGLLARRRTGFEAAGRKLERLALRGGEEGLWTGPAMARVQALVDQVADTEATVLIRGETGVGKELVARALHLRSRRRTRPCVKVNCAALPTELLESELFGYERGAFTGAHRRKPGRFEFAQGGTIFLDEIGELPPSLQAKLLQVLQDREFTPLGGDRDVRVDVRVVASTHQDLERALEAGRFREDLYYRLNVMTIRIPPLRERRDEIPGLVEHFLGKHAQPGASITALPPATLDAFQRYHWPGNVRELENVVRRMLILGTEEWAGQSPALAGASAPGPRAAATRTNLKAVAQRAAREAERVVIKQTLDAVRWNRLQAARHLGISYTALLYKIKACGLTPREPERPT